MTVQRVRLFEGGKLVVPASIRRELGIKPGDTLMADVVDGELRVRSIATALKRAQSIVRHYIPEGISLADELIADRRREAEGE